jgi:hypothetical protein
VKRRAHYLDKGFHICGMRFGWTFFISLIPIVGDITDASLNYFLVVRKARQADLPNWLVSRMMFNNAISLAVSFVPFAGDVVMAVFKANSRNAALLEEFLRIRGEEYLKLHPEEVEVASAKGKKSSGSGWFAKKKGKGDLSAKDAEQVKPGAGFKPGEMIEEVRVIPPESSRARAQSNAGMGTHTPPGQRSRKSSGGNSFTSFFSRSRRPSVADPVKQLTPGALQTNRGSRFIENVSSSSAAPSTTACQ